MNSYCFDTKETIYSICCVRPLGSCSWWQDHYHSPIIPTFVSCNNFLYICGFYYFFFLITRELLLNLFTLDFPFCRICQEDIGNQQNSPADKAWGLILRTGLSLLLQIKAKISSLLNLIRGLTLSDWILFQFISNLCLKPMDSHILVLQKERGKKKGRNILCFVLQIVQNLW